MRSRRSIVVLYFFTFCFVATTLAIYLSHKNEICIARQGRVPDSEFYKNALFASYRNNFLAISQQEMLLAQRSDGKSVVIRLPEKMQQQSDSALRGIIDGLSHNSKFLQSCCDRTWPDHGIDFGRPGFWPTLRGVSHRGVNIRRTLMTVPASMVIPPLVSKRGTLIVDSYSAGYHGRPLNQEKADIFIVMDVCGKVVSYWPSN